MTSAADHIQKALDTISNLETRFNDMMLDLDARLVAERQEMERQLALEKQTVENLLVKGASDSAALREWMARADKAEKERDEARLELGATKQAYCVVVKERDEARARLRPDEPCRGCPGCGSNDCPDALDWARFRAGRAEKAEAAFRSLLNEMSDADKGMGTWSMLWRLKTSEVFAAHPAPKAEGGAS